MICSQVSKRFIILLSTISRRKMGLKTEIKKQHKKKSRSDNLGIVSYWDEKEYWKGKTSDVFSVILRTKGCYWSYKSGCSMCGYYLDTNPDITQRALKNQLEESLEAYEGQEIVKIYTSGSFLDKNELPKDIAVEALESFDAKKIVVESRPEFINDKIVKKYSNKVDTLELAIGLESANDFVLENCINKGFTFDDYKAAINNLTADVSIRTYVLLKPPFLIENEAVQDVLKTIKEISNYTDVISINPLNVQKGTLVEKLWYRNLYGPPSLWSIIDIISQLDFVKNDIFVSTAGLGSKRGASNCENCDEKIIRVIKKINQTGEKEYLRHIPDCDCKERWEFTRELEPFLLCRGSTDILRDRYTGYV